MSFSKSVVITCRPFPFTVIGSLLKMRTHQNFIPLVGNGIINKPNSMGFNLEHSNRVFSLTNCAVLCQLTRRTWTECCLYMQNIHGLFFKHFYTIHKGALTGKKGEVSTNTMHYDKSGNGHIFCNAIFNLYNPPLRFGCWVVYESKTGLFLLL